MIKFRDISINKKLFYIMAIMAVLITTELVVLTYTIKILSSVRSYVGGEGLWSKAQKNASYYLIKYAYTHNEKDYQYYLKFLQVPLSDHVARIAISTVPVDYEKARKGFSGGRFHEDDIDGVIWLFTKFNRVNYIDKALKVWSEADDLMSEFVKVGSELHEMVSSQNATTEAISQKLILVDKLNDRLTLVEEEFSYTLGQASRWLESIILKLIISTAITVEFTSIFLTILTGLMISRSINSMNRVAKKITDGDFSERALVLSEDEIGQLATSLNTMIDELDRNIKHKQQLDEKFKSLLEGAPDAIIITNSSGNIVMINTRAEKIFGYSKSEIVNKKVKILIPPRIRKVLSEKDMVPFYNSEIISTLFGQDLYALRKDGVEFPAEVSFSPVNTAEGLLVLASVRDVTAKKNIESMLVDKNIQLVNSDLAKDQFMSHVSHELRTPLNGILTMTQLLLASPLTNEQKEELEIINDSNQQLLLVINQILDFSKVEAGTIGVDHTSFELDSFVEKLVAGYVIKSHSKGIQFVYSVDKNIPKEIVGDVVKIRQVLINLLDNAVKFTETGEINLHISSLVNDDSSESIKFEISDTGIGIAPNFLPMIFQPFFQCDASMTRKYGGTGLGLAISKKLAEAMNGSLAARSELGRTVFVFNIPLIGADKLLYNSETPIQKSHEIIIPKSNHNKRLLLIEDNTLNQRTLKILVQNMGYSVAIAEDGYQGLKLLSESAFYLVLMDCQMPVMDGFQATRRIREWEKGTNMHIPIIGVTAHAIEGYRSQCLDAGMDEYITKPFNIVDLHKIIESHILKEPCMLKIPFEDT
jgi:PAS domain S-box-containing protein